MSYDIGVFITSEATFSAIAEDAGPVCVTCGLRPFQVSTDRDPSPKAGGVSCIGNRFAPPILNYELNFCQTLAQNRQNVAPSTTTGQT
ncbi:MAG: hypothetical protein ACLFM4_02685 [Phormidium sp.]